MTIGVAINTKNEEAQIESVIKSVQFADQVVVIDMNSSDNTVQIAKKLGAEVFQVNDAHYVEPARNFALSKIKTDWTLVLDADERISKTLQERLLKIAGQDFSQVDEADAYKLPRKNIMFGQPVWHTGWWPDYVLRFFKTGKVDWPKTIHAQPLVSGKIVTVPASPDWAIEHHNYQSVSEFIARINRYTTIQAEQSQQQLSSNSPLTSLFHELFRRLFLFEGYKDGQRGVSLSVLQALSEATFSIKQREQKKLLDTTVSPEGLRTEINQLLAELRYWRADLVYQNKSGLERLFWRLRRKFRL